METRIYPCRFVFLFLFGPFLLLAHSSLSLASSYSWPLNKPTRVSSTIGEYRSNHLHEGIDFSTNLDGGRDVLAVEKGVVERVLFDPDKYGKTIIIRHPDGMRSWYSHLRSVAPDIRNQIQTEVVRFTDVQPQKKISINQGDVIAESGKTGNGTYHLHFALQRSDSSFINPIGRFDPELPFNPSPEVVSIRIFPLEGGTWINGQSQPVILNRSSKHPIQLWGRIGIDAVVKNTHVQSSSRTIPETIRLKHNGHTVYEKSFNEVSNSRQSLTMRKIYNEGLSNLSPTRFTLHLTPLDENDKWEGITLKEEFLQGNLTVEVEGVRGEKATQSLQYEIIPPTKRHEWKTSKQNNGIKASASRVYQKNKHFRVIEMNHLQIGKEQFSPPDFPNLNREPVPNLRTNWEFNRLNIALDIEGQWKGWPNLLVSKDDYDTEPGLIQTKPGFFRSWWTPRKDEEGWYALDLSLRGANGLVEERDRFYLQWLHLNSRGTVSSMDGRYFLHSGGEGMQFSSVVQIMPTTTSTNPSGEVTFVESPRIIRPIHLKSVKPLTLNVSLPRKLEKPRQVGIFKFNRVSRNWDVLSYDKELGDQRREAEVFGGGKYALLRDTKAPQIDLLRLNEETGRLQLSVEDSGSEVARDGISVKNGDQDVEFWWDSTQNRLRIPLKQLSDENIDIRVTATDRAGNKNSWKGTVSN